MYTEKLHILLAEDDKDDRLFFKEAFDAIKIDHTLTMVEDGFELMEYLRNAKVLPHIVFLDINMPVKSGIQCLREIRSDNGLSDISIAIYSTSVSDSNVEDAWQYVTDGLNRENFMISY
jgi:CheY-like chemotaxis protein